MGGRTWQRFVLGKNRWDPRATRSLPIPAMPFPEDLAGRTQGSDTGLDCTFEGIYLDDGFGMSILGADEPLTGAPDADRLVAASTHVDPGGRVRLQLFADKSRGQVHLQIFRHTFNEAGWRVAVDKVQYGLSLDLLGLGITTQGEGALYVPETKRQGMLIDIAATMESAAVDGTVARDDFETLVGRSSNLGQVAAEANVYPQPMYRMQNAKSKWVDKRSRRMVSFKPRRIQLRGSSPTQIRCHSRRWPGTRQRWKQVSQYR